MIVNVPATGFSTKMAEASSAVTHASSSTTTNTVTTTMSSDMMSTSTTTITTPLAVDWGDLSRKIRAVMRFAAFVGASCGGVDGGKRYDDKLYVFVEGQSEKAQKPLQLMWICPGLDSWDQETLPKVCQADVRDHEAMLRQVFSSYALVIRKSRGCWDCRILTPETPVVPPLTGRRVVCLPTTLADSFSV